MIDIRWIRMVLKPCPPLFSREGGGRVGSVGRLKGRVALGVLGVFLGVAACASDRSDSEASQAQQLDAAGSTRQAESLPVSRPAAGPEAPAMALGARLTQATVGHRPQGEDRIRARYPREWEVEVPPGTRLDSLRRELDRQVALLPPQDLEDQTPLPIWFRVYLRKQNPDLATSGPYQYPRTAPRLLRWMLAHPDSIGSNPR